MVITIDSLGLNQIYAAGQQVTVIRAVNGLVETSLPASTARAAGLVLAWLAFSPLESNSIDWQDQYSCYASTSPLVMGVTLVEAATSAAPMSIGPTYSFGNGQFKSVAGNGGALALANAMPSANLLLGLKQSATINAQAVAAPCCALPVLYGEAVNYVPSNILSFFLSSAAAPGTLLPPPGNTLTIEAMPGETGPTLGFNDQTNSFFQIS